MGFPKQYRFEHGARRDKIKMMGNGGWPRGDRADEAPDLFEPALPLGVMSEPAASALAQIAGNIGSRIRTSFQCGHIRSSRVP
jgi:hypothetical protein